MYTSIRTVTDNMTLEERHAYLIDELIRTSNVIEQHQDRLVELNKKISAELDRIDKILGAESTD